MTKSLKYGFSDKHRLKEECPWFIRHNQHNVMVCSGVQELFPSEHHLVPMPFHIFCSNRQWWSSLATP